MVPDLCGHLPRERREEKGSRVEAVLFPSQVHMHAVPRACNG